MIKEILTLKLVRDHHHQHHLKFSLFALIFFLNEKKNHIAKRTKIIVHDLNCEIQTVS